MREDRGGEGGQGKRKMESGEREGRAERSESRINSSISTRLHIHN